MRSNRCKYGKLNSTFLVYMKIFRLSILLAVTGLMLTCGNPEPVRIGYVAAITGRLSQLGIDGRNGVEMAVQERNDNGGVNGRRVELVVRDDESNPEVGIAVLNELTRDAAIDAVIGPLTSNMVPAVRSVDDAGVLIFSPIMSSGRLSGLDDHFIRANLTIELQAGILAEKMIRDGIRQTSVVLDLSNPQYTEELASHFKKMFESRSGLVTMDYPFNSAADPDFVKIADVIAGDRAPAVLFVTSGIDAGVLAQQLWKRNVEKALYAAEWAKTSDIISIGGRAVDGMVIATQFLPATPPFRVRAIQPALPGTVWCPSEFRRAVFIRDRRNSSGCNRKSRQHGSG